MTLNFPSSPTNGQTYSLANGATYTWDGEKWKASNIPDSSDVVQTTDTPVNGEILKWNGSAAVWDIASVVSDTTPQLGGDLDLNSNDITGTGDIDVTGTISVTSTDTGNTAGPRINLYRNSASPAVSDNLGEIVFNGENDADEKVKYSYIFSKILDESDGSEDGRMDFVVMGNGSSSTRLLLQGSGVTKFVNKDVLLSTGVNLLFEGASATANETTLTVADPTQDNTITLPDATGTVVLTSGGSVDVDSSKITNVTDPTSPQDAATKAYVDANAGVSASGGNFTGTVDFDGNVTQAVQAVSALDIDCSDGNYFTKTINANSTFTVSSVPASGTAYSFTLELTHTSGTVTWWSGLEWPAGTAPTLTTGKTHLFVFVTDDGGTRWRGAALVDYTN